MTEIINLRGHHLANLVDNLCYFADHYSENKSIKRALRKRCGVLKAFGYSDEHVKNNIRIYKDMIEGSVKVRIVDTLDDICEICNRRRIEGCGELCSSQYEANQFKDREVIKCYNLKLGKIYTSRYILRSLRRILPKDVWSLLKRDIKTK